MGRELSGQGDDVEQLKQVKRHAHLGMVDGCGKPLASNQLLPVRNFPLIATTEIDRNVMQPVGVKDGEIFMARLGANAS